MKNWIIIVLISILSVSAYGKLSQYMVIDTNSLEYRMLQNPDNFYLMTAALTASGVSEANLPGYLTVISNFEQDLKDNDLSQSGVNARSVIFSAMHKKFFRQYVESATTPDVLIKTGKFNCLSSTVFYNSLLEDFGFDYKAAVVPSHIFTVLTIDGKEIDVENTTPYGYDIGNNKDGQIIFKKLTGFEYNRSDTYLEVVGKRGILANLYANITHFAIEAHQYESAFQNSLRALAVYPEGRFARTNAVSAISYYTGYLTDRLRDYPTALAISADAVKELPEWPFFQSNYVTIQGEYIQDLAVKGRYAEAFSQYSNSQAVLGKNQYLTETLYSTVLDRLLRVDKNYDMAYQVIGRASADLSPNSPYVKSGIEAGFSHLVEKTIQDWKNAASNETVLLKWYALSKNDPMMDNNLEAWYLDIGSQIFKNSGIDATVAFLHHAATISPLKNKILNNSAAYTANTAVAAFNSGDYSSAIKYFKLALQDKPGDANILNNLNVAYRNKADQEMNDENYTAAALTVKDGLQIFPGDTKLTYYRDYLKKKGKY